MYRKSRKVIETIWGRFELEESGKRIQILYVTTGFRGQMQYTRIAEVQGLVAAMNFRTIFNSVYGEDHTAIDR